MATVLKAVSVEWWEQKPFRIVNKDGRIGDTEYRQLLGRVLLQQQGEHWSGGWRGHDIKEVSLKVTAISVCLCANRNNGVERNFFYKTEKRHLRRKDPQEARPASQSSFHKWPEAPCQAIRSPRVGHGAQKCTFFLQFLQSSDSCIYRLSYFGTTKGSLRVTQWVSHERLL